MRTKQLSGGARLLAAGKKPVCLGLTEAEHGLLREAAALEGRPMTQFALFHALAAAKKLFLKK